MVMDSITKDSCLSPNQHRWSVGRRALAQVSDVELLSLSRLGIGLDSCVIPLRHGGLFLVQSTDFFYPLVDDPYVMVGVAQGGSG